MEQEQNISTSDLVAISVNGVQYLMSTEDAAAVTSLTARADYLDRWQYTLKIKLNSLYGALSNPHFRYFDPRMGNSTTGTGRYILEHITKKVGEYFDGKYEYPTPSAIYGDTDSVDANSLVDINDVVNTIEYHFEHLAATRGTFTKGEKEVLKYNGSDITSRCYDPISSTTTPKSVRTIYRSKSQKRMYRVTTSNNKTVIVTEDHSLIILREGKLVDVTPTQLCIGDTVITASP